MNYKHFNRINNLATLHSEATAFHKRLRRTAPDDNGNSKVDPKALDALCGAAEKLGVVNAFDSSARGVVFFQKKDEILAGERPLRHDDAISAAGFIARQARKALEV